ncbi:MAG: NAD(P)(+) transhydrogenase (Re/Si-specific) subunit beta [Armatimonadota bacterium]|nr:NAD(P)(+) transhydrogenase (Re/Si-specific) subunit beta [Armatimonadota bacterium]
MNSPKTARLGNLLAALGMAAAVAATLELEMIPAVNLLAILVASAAGGAIGWVMARRVQMTAMPQMVALFNGLGGGAVALVALIEFMSGGFGLGEKITTASSTVVGAISFSGSMIAFGKLQELLPGKPIVFPGLKVLNLLLLGGMVALVILVVGTNMMSAYLALLIIATLVGIMMVLPIGGADMPVVISLLNSFTGVAAGLAGFVLENSALLIGGGLVGASGLILTLQMCKAMNRSLESVIFGAFTGAVAGGGGALESSTGTVRSYSPEDAAIVFVSASSVAIVPGYGMAVAQAQHVVKELADRLAAMGIEVKYAIHPVAGRMPGHMNVLLAEADVPYDQLYDLDDINPELPETDVALVIGANDVTNPAARYDKNSPIYGMPILDVDKAKTCMVCKRSMNPGYAGIDNELYGLPNTVMLFGDAKATISKIIAALNDL